MYYFHALYSLYVFSLAKNVQFILEISLKYRQDPHSGGSLGCRLRGLQSTWKRVIFFHTIKIFSFKIFLLVFFLNLKEWNVLHFDPNKFDFIGTHFK